MDMMELRRQIALNEPHIVTTTPTGVASFSTDLIAPLKSCKVEFSPVQAGTGDPSPDNVRPISGWDGLTVTRCGKNLFDGANYTAGELVPIHIAVGTPVTVSIKAIAGDTASQVRYYDANQTQIDYWTLIYDSTLNRNVRSFSIINRDCEYVAITGGSANEPQLELGSTATPYEPYTGSTIPIDWTAEAGTVYGGSLDVTTGLLTVRHRIVDLGSLDWSYNSGALRFDCLRSTTVLQAKSIAGDKVPNAFCTIYRPVTFNQNYGASGPDNVFFFDTSLLRVRNKAYTDAATFKAAMSGVQLVYELATPVTYQLTPTQLKSLRGVNNIWSDANGDTTVKYWTH